MATGGYTRVTNVALKDMELCGTKVAVREDLDEKIRSNGLVVLSQKATTVGVVLLVGTRVEEDLLVGDKVIYGEWQGGRWQLDDGTKMLIMDIEHVLLVIDREPVVD